MGQSRVTPFLDGGMSQDDDREYCDGCGQLCVPFASTPLNKLLCKECADAALAEPDMSPLLTTVELAKLRAKSVAGTFDSLDFEAALYHADEVTRRYEALVQHTNAANGPAPIGSLHRDEKAERLREQLVSLREAIVLNAFRVNAKAITALEALEAICAANRRLNHHEVER